MCQIFLTAKDLKAFYPNASLYGLQRYNTKLKNLAGKTRRQKLTIYDLEQLLQISLAEIKARLT